MPAAPTRSNGTADCRPLRAVLGELGPSVRAARRVLVCSDFDGTLAPTVSQAGDAVLPQATRCLLQQLAGEDAIAVAVLSGRALADVSRRVALASLTYAGNHGLEIAGRGFKFIEETATQRRDDLQALGRELAARLRTTRGCWVEDKGLSLCVHYRQAAPEQRPAVHAAVEAAAAGLEPWLRVTPGRCTWDLRPGFHWHKGSAAQWLQRRLEFEDALVICLGDDTTDEDLFQAYPHGVTIKVHSPSPPGDARQESNCNGTHARFQVALPADVQSFLAWLLDLRRRESRENPRDRQRSALVQGRHFL